MFIHMNTWMTEKSLMKHHYLKKELYNRRDIEDITDADYKHTIDKDYEKIIMSYALGCE